jgi:hypothetical protein
MAQWGGGGIPLTLGLVKINIQQRELNKVLVRTYSSLRSYFNKKALALLLSKDFAI